MSCDRQELTCLSTLSTILAQSKPTGMSKKFSNIQNLSTKATNDQNNRKTFRSFDHISAISLTNQNCINDCIYLKTQNFL